MSAGAFLGIDLGTSAVKALVQDATGTVLAKARVAYPTLTPRPNRAEQSPDDWWTAVLKAIADVRDRLEPATRIEAVGLSGQLNGFVLLDDAGKPLHHAVLWLDLRATDVTRRIESTAGERILARTGNALSPIAVLPTLAWFAESLPDLAARVHRVALVKDYLLLRLTGTLATDPSDAGCTALMDLESQTWLPDLCATAGQPAERLPPIRPSAAVAGHLTPAAAVETGLRPETPVVTGAGDVAALAVGCGAVRRDRLAITLGTAGHVVLDAEDRSPPAPGSVWQLAHAIPGHRLWLGLVMGAGLSLTWGRSLLTMAGTPPSYDDLEALAAQAPPGSGGVTFLPFLEGASTPYHRPDARGSLHGLASTHGGPEVVRAVLEGVAFNVRQCVDLFESLGASIGEIRLAEGGAQMPLWCRIIANSLDRPIRLVDELDTSAAGAAILAQAGFHAAPVEEIAETVVKMGAVFDPDPAARNATQDAFGRYQDLGDRLYSGRPPERH